MRKSTVGSLMTAAVVVLGTMSFSVPAGAEGGLTLEERVERLERKNEVPAAAPTDLTDIQKRLDQIEAHIKNLPFGIKLGGGIATSYTYDLNQPDNHQISLRAFDRDHNSFVLDLFQLQISRAPGDNGVGFLTKVNFGKTAERSAADWHGDGSPGMCGGANGDHTCDVEVEEAYITYNPPSLSDLQLKAGKFVTPLGAEVIEPWANPNISRSLAFSWAIPFTHTGASASYAFTQQVSLLLGVVNGWDNVVDSNDGKTVLGSFSVTPVDQFSFLLNGTYGPEQVDHGNSKRGVIDAVATIKPIDNVALILNYDYGNESHLPVDIAGNTHGTADWNAFSGIVSVDVPDVLPLPVGFALRGEYFDDSDGTRLPTPKNDGFGHYQNAWEVTSTFKVVIAEGLMFRTEYRYDKAKHDLFEKELVGTNDTQNDQHTIGADLTYVF